jgi:hypothetical protein
MEADTMIERQREQIEKHGLRAQGRSELLKHLDNETISMKEAILAKCYDCTGYYSDGRMDCKLPACSLYPYMPYRDDKKPAPPQRRFSEETKAAHAEHLRKINRDRRRDTPTFGLEARQYGCSRNYLPKDDTTPVSGVPDRLSTGKHTLQTNKDVSELGTGPQDTPTFAPEAR